MFDKFRDPAVKTDYFAFCLCRCRPGQVFPYIAYSKMVKFTIQQRFSGKINCQKWLTAVKYTPWPQIHANLGMTYPSFIPFYFKFSAATIKTHKVKVACQTVGPITHLIHSGNIVLKIYSKNHMFSGEITLKIKFIQ